MACSRTPKRRLRPAGCAVEKSSSPASRVLFDSARSAEPPRSSGRTGAIACRTLPDTARVASRLVGRSEARQRFRPALGQGARGAAIELARQRRFGGDEAPAALVPGPRQRRAAVSRGGERSAGRIWNQEGRLGRPAERRLGEPGLLGAERGAVRLGAVLFVRAAEADVGAHDDERRAGSSRPPRWPSPRRARARSLPSATSITCQP